MLMKNFTLKIFMVVCMLFAAGLSYGQFKFGDKSTVGQTLTLGDEVATLNVTFDTDKALSSAVQLTDTTYDISIQKCTTNKGFQVNVFDEVGDKKVNSDFECRDYNNYRNPVHVASVESLQDILNAYHVNDSTDTSHSLTLPAHCLFDISSDNQAFGAYPGKYKQVEYGFHIKFNGSIVENDITFDIDTYNEGVGLGGATSSYELTVYIGGTDVANLVSNCS